MKFLISPTVCVRFILHTILLIVSSAEAIFEVGPKVALAWSRQPDGVEYWSLVDFDPPRISSLVSVAHWGRPHRRIFQALGVHSRRWGERGLQVGCQYRRRLVLVR